jgi:hypothetical protein
LQLLALSGAIAWMLPGCSWFGGHHKVKSYDQAIYDEDKDPTYRDDPEKAGDETNSQQ